MLPLLELLHSLQLSLAHTHTGISSSSYGPTSDWLSSSPEATQRDRIAVYSLCALVRFLCALLHSLHPSVSISIYICICTSRSNSIYMYIHTYIYIYIHTYTYIYKNTYVCTHAYHNIYMYIYLYMYMYNIIIAPLPEYGSHVVYFFLKETQTFS